jgi:serine/threonine-protein kinase
MGNPSQQTGQGLVPGVVIDGRYKVVRFLGQGGNGLVHEVEHMLTGRRLALKSLLDETGAARLEQEARATSLMRNEHVTRVTDMGMEGPAGPYLVMELLEGSSLRDLLDEAGQLPLELTVNMALQVCECLAEAHAHGIIHRDLKPENIYLSPSPWPGQHAVKVLDFGVVKIASDGPIPNSSLTRTGSTVGTPYYMSLEQLRNSSAVDQRADIYSLGVVLYECLSGKKPFQADTIGDLVFALCSGPPTHLSRVRPDLPNDIAEMVMRTLSTNREQRPATMIDLATALLPHGNVAFGVWVRVNGKPIALAEPPRRSIPPPTPTPKPAPKPSSKRTIPMVAVGALPPRPDATQKPPEPRKALTMMGVGGLGVAESEPPPSWQSSETAPEVSTGNRDTPTEMYRKEHEEAAAASASPGGDRDTPTTAFQAQDPQALQALAALAPTASSAPPPMAPRFGPPPPRAPAPVADPPSYADRPSQAPSSAAHDPSSSGVRGPMLSTSTIPMGGAGAAVRMEVQAARAALAAAPPAAPSAEADTLRPGWKKSLDGALVGVGRSLEVAVRKLRTAPHGTQIAILASVAVVALIFFVTFVWLLVRS